MSEKQKNRRRSQWQVVNRCLNILLRLMRGNASSEELLQIVCDDAIAEEENLAIHLAKDRFEEDRARLREWFLAELKYDRGHDEYSLEDIGRPLIDLPENALTAMAFLEQSFSDKAAPMRNEVQELLGYIKILLPHSSQKTLKKQRGLLELNLKARDSDLIQDAVFEAVQTACAAQRQLQFEYLSPQQADEKIRHHLVEPIRYFFDTTRGHYYLEAYCIEVRGPFGVIPQEKVITYRLGRMQNPEPLPKHFLPRNLPEYPLDYVLSANIARLGVTEHFAKTQIFPNEDGSVLVRAISHNLFFDLRTLLHYGENCRVTGGDEAVKEMKQVVKNLYGVYFDSLENNS